MVIAEFLELREFIKSIPVIDVSPLRFVAHVRITLTT
jgi:hypothetical protein